MAVKCREIRGFAKCVAFLYRGTARVARLSFTPSLLSYFGWSGIIYAVCGLFAILEWYPIYDLFCDMPAKEKGCDKCADTLLMCNKEQCWQDAVNHTYQAEASDADGRYFETMRKAVQDLDCNTLVETSSDPIVMLQKINSSSTVTKYCREWNCQVAVKAFQASECGSLCNATTSALKCNAAACATQLMSICSGTRSATGLEQAYKGLCLQSTAQARLLRPADYGVPGPWHDAAWRPQEAAPAAREAGERRLSADSTTSSDGFLAANGDWDVSGWSSCTCLQQCTAGVRTRSVTCPSGIGNCDPADEPVSVEACECWHCARCTVRWSILGFSAGYFFQGGCSLLLCLAFARVSFYLDEEDLTQISLSMKLLGGVCKILPRLVRCCSFVSLIAILVLITQTFLPSGEMNVACKQNGKLQVMAILITLCWLMQLIIGVYMKRRSPMPAYLFNARRPGVMRALCRPVRAIGP